ncbi:MAG: sugar ABC transporter substrate-binding protein [Ardenticatenaceae bacterium]|nr:sugar ABC transporter substrate-binding protein [Ardenticatenaceae bacterium]MCB9445109.1 sugar ABC transporter substrate-binding protein [Ardenticatenaceae bacterium]
MKKMANRFMLLLFMIGLPMLIANCATKPVVTPVSPVQESTNSLATAVPYNAPQAITLYLSDWHLTEPHWEKAITEMILVFEQENPGIKVQLDPIPYAEKEASYITEIQAGGGPDLMHLHGFSIRSFIEKGFLYDLTPFIQQENKTVWGGEFTETWYPQTIELMQYQDRLYALPSDFMSMVLFYNKNLFIEAGLDPDKPPANWDEFLVYAEALTRDRNNDGQIDTWGFGTVGSVDPGFELRFTPILLSHGASYLTPDNRCSALNSPEAKAAFNFYVSLVTEHQVVPPGVTTQNPGGVRQQMADEQVAMIIGSGWTVPIVSGLNPDLNATETLAAAPIPIASGQTIQKPTTAWISAWMINRNTKHPQEAWLLLKFMTSRLADEKWFMDARVLSARRDVSGGLEDLGVTPFEPLLNDPFSKVIAEVLPHAQFVPQIKEWPQIIEIVNRAVQSSFSGAKTADQALRDAHDEINIILSNYRSPDETCPAY